MLLDYGGGHKKLTILGCALSGISAVLSMAPYICIWFIARGVFEIMPGFQKGAYLIKYGWIALWFALASMAIYFAALMCTHLAAFRTAKNMRMEAAKHLVELPLGYFSVHQSGRLRKQIDDNAGMTETLLAHELPDLTGAVVTPVVTVVLLFVFDWRMGILCLIPGGRFRISAETDDGRRKRGLFQPVPDGHGRSQRGSHRIRKRYSGCESIPADGIFL